MKKPELTFTRLLLIVLGVIVAIIIGLNSSAVGMEETHSQLIDIVPEHTRSLAVEAANFVGKQVVSQFKGWI